MGPKPGVIFRERVSLKAQVAGIRQGLTEAVRMRLSRISAFMPRTLPACTFLEGAGLSSLGNSTVRSALYTWCLLMRKLCEVFSISFGYMGLGVPSYHDRGGGCVDLGCTGS